ncbi:MAG: quinol oxidase [Nitrospirae bacterium CG_4_9_14_3_um_filter_51_5]|nr:MAG: quinol oxidase [Nitrospirae bacterium CG_4_9_14_3_um_filter_51_5]
MVMPSVICYTRLIFGLALVVGQWSFPSSLYAQTSASSLPIVEESDWQQVVISMESYAFTPSEVVVEAGKPVTLTVSNQSFLVPHNFLLDDPNGVRLVDADISSGDTEVVTLTLTEPGFYPFYCDKKLLFFPNHREQGMEGRLIVR